MPSPISLIIGLGNPGESYEKTRHNAGAWFVNTYADLENLSLKYESKFKGFHTAFRFKDQRIHLFIPNTYMNESGQAVRAISQFYDIASENILVAHDELDLEPGDTRLKFSGGHGGHNGLRDIIAHLQSSDFYRLRIGIGHPGERHTVTNYVLSTPSKIDKDLIDASFMPAFNIMPYLFEGAAEKAMQVLHTK